MFILGLFIGATGLFLVTAFGVIVISAIFKVTNSAVLIGIGVGLPILAGLFSGWRALKELTPSSMFLVGCSLGLLGATGLCAMMLSGLGQH